MKYNLKLFVILAFTGMLLLSSCTKNAKARFWGRKTSYNLPVNTKLVNATWKEANLWVLVEPVTDTNYQPKTYKFFEDSHHGIMEGEITFIEVSNK